MFHNMNWCIFKELVKLFLMDIMENINLIEVT